MSKYEVVYPNTIKYEPKIKNLSFEIYGKVYKVNAGIRNLMRIDKMTKKLKEDSEVTFDILDKIFFAGFCDEIEEKEPNFPFDDFLYTVMDAIENAAPEALKGEETEKADEDAEPKKE